MKNISEEIKPLSMKRLYTDALYWHLIHHGYTVSQAEFESARITHHKNVVSNIDELC